jgi:hypothetical protein
LSEASTGPPLEGVALAKAGPCPNSVLLVVAWVLCVSRALLCEKVE